MCVMWEKQIQGRKKGIYLSGIIFAYDSLWLSGLRAFVEVPFKQVIKMANLSV